MIKRLIAAAVIFGTASLAGFLPPEKSTGTGLPIFAAKFSNVKFFDIKPFDLKPFDINFLNVQEAAGSAAIDEKDRVVLHGNVNPKARPEFDVGPTGPALPMERMILLLKIAPEKQAALDRLAAEQQDRSSPNFHHWLTPDEFGTRFGRSPEEIATVKGWLITQGFTIDETARGGNWINFSGTAADVDRAFHANMHDYRVEGTLHHANSTDPSIPRALADLVAGPVSLHDFPHKAMHTPPRQILGAKKSGIEEGEQAEPKPGYTEPPDIGGYDLAPGDFATIYDVNSVYSMGYDGRGVTIAIVGRTHQANAIAKWNHYRSIYGLSYKPAVVTVNGHDPGDWGADEDSEADLDVEWSGAVAKGATIHFVTSKQTNTTEGSDLSAQYIVDKNLAPIISDCFAVCEAKGQSSGTASFYNTLWEQAATQGMTVFVVSGDSGAYGCDFTSKGKLYPQGQSVNSIASTPFNIAVGGTSLSDSPDYWNAANGKYGVSALGYVPEAAWNSYNEQEQWTEWASGGGASTINTKPGWQVCPGVPSDGFRDLPDVSLNADPYTGYRVFTCNNNSGPCGGNGIWVMGGTSAASPSFAGIMALIVQSTGGNRQGNVNSILYQLGNAQYSGTPGASAVFHDITSGANGFVGNDVSLPGYSCGPGYDLVTGLGSVDAANLLLAFQAFQEGGSLTVTINPPVAASAGAMWKLDNGPWNASGAPVSGPGVGLHKLDFKHVPGWQTPAGQTVFISYGQAQTASATYVPGSPPPPPPPCVPSRSCFDTNGEPEAAAQPPGG